MRDKWAGRCAAAAMWMAMFGAMALHAQTATTTAITMGSGIPGTDVGKRSFSMPIVFEENRGQFPEDTSFVVRNAGGSVHFTDRGPEFWLGKQDKLTIVDLLPEGRSSRAVPAGEDPLPGKVNYLVGTDASKWKTGIATYGKVRYRRFMPGVDLSFYGNSNQLEQDFVVAPGINPANVRFKLRGAQRVQLNRAGEIEITAGGSQLLLRKPVGYQMIDGRRSPVDVAFVTSGSNRVGFRVGAYDPSRELVIDPVLDYATYLSNLSLYIYGTAVDTAGNTYVIGQSFSSSYPVTTGAYQTTCPACANNYPDIFITKLNATGTEQVYSTFLGGSGYNQPAKIVVDGSGDAIVTGYTGSADFPLKNPISAGVPSSEDGFVTSLAPDGASLNFSSRLGGAASQDGFSFTLPGGIAVDTSGNVYVAGITSSTYLPVTPGALNAGSPNTNSPYAFLTKLQPTGNLAYSALVGDIGVASDCCAIAGLAVDSAGNAYLAGSAGATYSTSSVLWPTTSSAYLSSGNAVETFAAKVSADGSTLVYSTLVVPGIASGMALTSNNQIILVGTSNAGGPVTSNAYSSTAGTSFIAELSADGTQLPYFGYFSTPTGDTGGTITSVALDAAGDLWVAGNTQYTNNIPVVDPLQSVPGSTTGSAFVSEFNPAINQLLFSTYFNGAQGGSKIDGLAIDGQGRAHIVGTGADDLPTTATAYLSAVPAPPANNSYTFGFAALIDASVPGPGICYSGGSSGFTQVGSSGQASVTITNCGNGPLTISNIQLSSAVFALTSLGNCVGSLAAGASCTVEASFTPPSTGGYSAVVTVASNAPISNLNISIYGVGTAPVISVITPSISFPAQVLGNTASGSDEDVFIVNKGTAPLIVYPAQSTITGPFSIVKNDCGSPLPANQSLACTFVLSFTPTVLGPSTGTLTIASNDPVNPTVSVPLSGSAVANFTTPTITNLSNPSVAVGSTGVKLSIYGANFFPESEVLIGGELQTLTASGSSILEVNVDPSLLTLVGELPVVVVNPSPGGQSNSYPLLVFQALPISAASLVYNSTTGMLYASIPSSATANANTVLPINPLTGVTGTPIPVGNNPGKLAVSSDGSYLYVGLNGDHTLQRINLATSQIERTFSLPNDSLLNLATTVGDMHGVPGSPQSVVVSLSKPASPGEAGAALFTDAGLASYLGDIGTSDDIDSFAFTSNPSIFYAYPFNATFFGETGITANTLSIITEPGFGCCNQTTGSLVASDGTLLYTNSGEVWNPATPALLGTYSATSGMLFYEPSVVPDTANGRTFMLDTFSGYNGFSGYTDILSFNQASFAQVGSVSVSVPEYSFVSDLNRWGSDGFAFRSYYQTSSDEIVLLRSSIVHTATGGTPSLSSLAPANAAVGTATSQITVNGNGFIPGTIVQWNGVAMETAYVSATQLTALVPSSEFTSEGTAQITVVNPAPGGSSSALTFTILGPVVTLSNTNLAFGVIQEGNTSGSQINVENSGNAALTGLTLALTGANASSFSESSSCGSNLAAGTSCTVNLTFAPSAVGPLQASLTLTDNAPASPQTVALTGTGESLSVVVTPSASSITKLQALTVTVAVSGGSGNQVPTGSVTLSSGSYTSAAASLNNGSTQIVVPAGSLSTGSDTLTVTYVPDTTSSSIYTGASATASVTVNEATPTITWAAPAAITYGAALSATQLNAAANVPGSFAYSPAAGTVLNAGTQTLSVTFTPTDTTDYTTATTTVQLTVNQAASTITWAAPAAIAYGAALGATQLNATANVPGSFAYTPPAGTVLPLGNNSLSVTFTPTNATDYTSATDTVMIAVNQPVPSITSLSPAIVSAGGAAFTLTVNGAGFTQSSVVMWGSGALTTTYVSGTQLTAQVTVADIANTGPVSVTVQNPSPGGASNSFEFEVASAGSGSPVFMPATVTVAPGTTANYPVTLPSGATNVSVSCLNLPAGATCSYSITTGDLSIATSSTTPAGTYQITAVFAETLPGVAPAWLLPLFVLPLSLIARRRGARRLWLVLCIAAFLGFAVSGIGCGGSSSSGQQTQQTYQATSAGTVTLIVQ